MTKERDVDDGFPGPPRQAGEVRLINVNRSE